MEKKKHGKVKFKRKQCHDPPGTLTSKASSIRTQLKKLFLGGFRWQFCIFCGFQPVKLFQTTWKNLKCEWNLFPIINFGITYCSYGKTNQIALGSHTPNVLHQLERRMMIWRAIGMTACARQPFLRKGAMHQHARSHVASPSEGQDGEVGKWPVTLGTMLSWRRSSMILLGDLQHLTASRRW